MTLIAWAGMLLVVLLGVLVFIAARTAASLKFTEEMMAGELDALKVQVELNRQLANTVIATLGNIIPPTEVQSQADVVAATNTALQSAGIVPTP